MAVTMSSGRARRRPALALVLAAAALAALPGCSPDPPANFAAKCTLTLNRAYLWNGNVDALLDRFDSCPAEVADVRGYWKEFGGKPRSRDDSRPYDPGDLPELACDGVTMAFASSRGEGGLDIMPGSQVWDPDGGMYDPYRWAPEGEPWLEAGKRTRGEGRFMIAMTVSEDYWKLEEAYFHR
ncbi:hypothetical protein [Nonomuraea sp. NPDC049709]|uniref:hypothetical protein n=1 Tax=Nonomuraea sp. NPDC049709 TaxID=3154736 RepID=UPI003421CD03